MLWLQSLNLDYAFWLTISAIFVLLLLSAFFSGSETALTAASRGKLQTQADKGSRGASRALSITEDNERLIGSVLLGNNLVNILATSLATALFTKLVGESSVALATLVMTFLVLIFAEVLPKTYAINRPNRTALLISPIIYFLNKILFIFVFVINLIVKLIFRRNDNDIKNNDLQSEEELKEVIDLYKTSNPDYEQEKDMLQSILQLNDITVEEIFTHRKNIYSIDSSLKTSEIIQRINNSRYTRIPFWKDNPENIIGLLNVRTLNIDLKNHNESKEIIFDKISNPWFIPETTNLLEQLVEFKKRKEHLAFVVDEYGELLKGTKNGK